MKTDLNKLFDNRYQSNENNSGVTVNFHGNEDFICSKISKAQAVVGCAPWFTSEKILNSLGEVENGVSIILDKTNICYSKHLNLKIKHLEFQVSSLPSDYFFTRIDPTKFNPEAFRVIGRDQSKQEKKTTFHYKFFVLCNVTFGQFNDIRLIPESVLCGSFNFTKNATESREALTFIEIKEVADEFYAEWARAYMLSERVNGFSNDLNPEFLSVETEEEVVSLLNTESKELERQINANDGYNKSDKDY